MATMKTIRQVKTVFIIFIAFVCCWSPYIVVLLYDNSHSLPLPVHLYASMLAHLHASLNFAIYGLINLHSSFASHLSACCCRRVTSLTTAAAASMTAAAAVHGSCSVQRTSGRGTGYMRGVEVNRSFIAVHEIHGCSSRNVQRHTLSTFSAC